MPIPIAVSIRQQIIARREGGENLGEIARDLQMAYDSVRNVWRLHQREGRIHPNYANCGSKEPHTSQRVYRTALFLKYAHPTWGAPLIRHLIQQKWADEVVPSERSLQRWFKQAGYHAPRKKIPGERRKGRSPVVHAVWELDSREDIHLANGQPLVWLVVSDEASGAILKGQVFPSGQSEPTEG